MHAWLEWPVLLMAFLSMAEAMVKLAIYLSRNMKNRWKMFNIGIHSIIKPLPRFLLLAALGLFVYPAWSTEKNPGGKGTLKSSCFKANSGTVTEVCAEYTINWKMWSLMGEPVEDYTEMTEVTTTDMS